MTHRFTTRIFLTAALTSVIGLAFVSGASAMRNDRDPFNLGYGRGEIAPVVSNSSSGVNWGLIAVVAGLIVTVAVITFAVAQVGRHRSLAPAH